jgi:hypothetical protein
VRTPAAVTLSLCGACAASSSAILKIKEHAGALTAIWRAANPLQIGHLVRGFSGLEVFDASPPIAWGHGAVTGLVWLS